MPPRSARSAARATPPRSRSAGANYSNLCTTFGVRARLARAVATSTRAGAGAVGVFEAAATAALDGFAGGGGGGGNGGDELLRRSYRPPLTLTQLTPRGVLLLPHGGERIERTAEPAAADATDGEVVARRSCWRASSRSVASPLTRLKRARCAASCSCSSRMAARRPAVSCHSCAVALKVPERRCCHERTSGLR